METSQMTDSHERLRNYIEQLVGPGGLRIADALLARESATDTELSEELGEKPSHIRKVLYDLYEARLAEYKKEKDKDTGWLTFHWQIRPTHANANLGEKIKRDLADLQRSLEYESTHQFFICPTGAERFDFGRATESDFQCPEHGAILEQHDNNAEVEALRVRVAALLRETEPAS